MIFLEIPFFRHYVFAVVQTASKPHPTRGRTTLTARARRKAGQTFCPTRPTCPLHPAPCPLHPAPCTLHPAPCTLHPAPCTLHPASVIQQEKTKGTTTTGTVAPLFKPHAVPSFKATPHRKFRTTITQNLVFCERFSKNRCASCWP